LVMMLNPQKTKDVLTTVEKDGNSLDVVVQQEQSAQPETVDELLDKKIPTALGETVPLSDIVKVKKGSTYNTLDRSKGEYYATVSGTVKGDDISKVTSQIGKKVDKLDLPKGVTVETAGVQADMEETFTQLGMAMLAAVAIVYFILVVTFHEGV